MRAARNMAFFCLGFALMVGLAQCTSACEVGKVRPFIEAGVGLNASETIWGRKDWEGDVPVSVGAGLHYQHDKHTYLRGFYLEHISNLDKGAPLNKETETTLDVFWLGKAGYYF